MGNLSGWNGTKIIKKDAKGTWKLGPIALPTTLVSVVLTTFFGIGYLYNYLYTDYKPSPYDVTSPAVTAPENPDSNNVFSAQFSSSTLQADLIIPSGPVDIYKFVRIKSSESASHFDLLVMTNLNGQILFIDAVETSHKNEWVFTGPPGQYSIRLTSFDVDTGFSSTTGNVVIGVPPAPTPVPVPPGPNPPGPVPPGPTPNPSPVVVIPDGKFAIGPLVYKVVREQVPASSKSFKNSEGKDIYYANQLADNFEGVAAAIAAGSFKTPDEANKELAGRNRLTFATNPAALTAWMPFFTAWAEKATELNKAGKLPNVAAEYRLFYLETVEGLRGTTK